MNCCHYTYILFRLAWQMVKGPEHIALARKLSAMSTVLLKNDGNLLPLSLAKKQ